LVSITFTTDAINNKKPITGQAIVRHDGTLDFGGGQPSDDLSLIMPYLATNYFGDRDLKKGAAWQTESEQNGVQIVSSFNVTGVTDDTADVGVVMQTEKGYLHGAMTVDEKLVYRTKRAVPKSLDVTIKRLYTQSEQGADVHSYFHFRLASDTADSAAASP